MARVADGNTKPDGISLIRSAALLIQEYKKRIVCLCLGGLESSEDLSMNSKLLTSIAGLVLSAIFSTAPANAATFVFGVNLDGPSEFPPNTSPGTGAATVTFDNVAFTMTVDVTFQNLVSSFGTPPVPSGTTVAHIHCCTASPGTGTAGVATTLPTFAGFPAGVTSGHYVNTFDMLAAGSYNPAFLLANGNSTNTAFAALLAGASAGTEYLNIHSNAFPGGEIRGFLAPVPLPAALPLFATGLGATGLLAWRRKRKTAAAAAA